MFLALIALDILAIVGTVPRRFQGILSKSVLLFVVPALLGVLVGCDDHSDSTAKQLKECKSPDVIRVASYPAGVWLYRKAVHEFEKANAEQNGGCVQVSPYVYGVTMSDLRSGVENKWQYPEWNGEASAKPAGATGYQDLPRPDVVLTETESDLDSLGGAFIDTARKKNVFTTNLMLFGNGGQRQGSLSDAIEASDGLRIAHPAPRGDSGIGALSTAWLYTRGARAELLSPEQAQKLESRVDGSFGSRSTGDDTSESNPEIELLCEHQKLPEDQQRQTALLITEQAYRQYKAIRPCGEQQTSLKPILEDQYSALLNRAVAPVKDAEREASSRKAGATAFLDWLTSERGGTAAIRNVLGPMGKESQSDQRLTEVRIELPVVDKAQQLYQTSKRRRQILVLVDTSGSMAAANRTELARRGAQTIANRVRASDMFGIWSFAAEPVRHLPVEAAPVGSTHQRRAAEAIGRIPAPRGPTGMCQAIVQGRQVLDPHDATAVIVLTDGDDPCGTPEVEGTWADSRLVVVAVDGNGNGNGRRCQLHGSGTPTCNTPDPEGVGHLLETIVREI